MATDLAIIIILGLLAGTIFTKLRLPGLLGMLILGIVIGPYGLNWLSDDILSISGDLRKIALVIILLRAGLGISKEQIVKVGSAAVKISCIPVLLEGFTVALISTVILNFSFVEGGILGFIIAAVSPAVIVPAMLEYIEKGVGSAKGIPTLILAGASIDDVFAITVFTAFIGFYSAGSVNVLTQILNIPISIVFGIGIGFLIAMALIFLFKKYSIRDTYKVLYVLGFTILFTTLESFLQNKIAIAGLLGVMTVGFVFREKQPDVAKVLSVKFNKIWILAEVLLFVLVGARMNITVAVNAGLIGMLIIFIGLLARSLGVILSLYGTDFNLKEKVFCMIAYSPKATVQAAIGAIPLSMGMESGDLILAIAVMAIIITAPLGSIGIRATGKKLLE
ncbi:UNVERIFIED_CONTAM: sodium/proton antiporter (CPA1 family) [Acetivibrio alkalicellulosi]